jgi:hypothetical protein
MTTLEALREALPKLSPSDANFAASLLRQAASRPLSPKQLPWVDKLVERASAPPKAAGPSAEVGSLSGILALFDKAKSKLKFPAIVLSVPEAGMSVRINVAGVKSKAPGSLNVMSMERTEPSQWGNLQRAFYGRVSTAGVYSSSAKGEPLFAALSARLKTFAGNPAQVAGEQGKLTGSCCFCNLALTDERSTAVGYGATCAKNWGLPWGGSKNAGPLSASLFTAEPVESVTSPPARKPRAAFKSRLAYEYQDAAPGVEKQMEF